VSVSLRSSMPAASSSARSGAKFSMIPLWMTATALAVSRCGWALRSVGAPWVAQRVCPMPVLPVIPPGWSAAIAFSRFSIRPARFSTTSSPSSTATPEES
jgi:hypothetical protein